MKSHLINKLWSFTKKPKSRPSYLRYLASGSFIRVSDLRNSSDISTIRAKIDTMRSLAEDAQIKTALSYYATDSTTTNTAGQIIWATAEDDELAKIINTLFNKWNINLYVRDHILELATIGNLYIPTTEMYRSPSEKNVSYEDTPIDRERMNFTRAHKGVQSVLDPETNNLYYEKVIPIKLSYSLTILTTNTADMDELIRELLFKYLNMYFLTITLPYECNRKVRFGISIQTESDIQRSSGNLEYIESGKLYQSIIPLTCEGCVLVSYTPAHLKRSKHEIDASNTKV